MDLSQFFLDRKVLESIATFLPKFRQFEHFCQKFSAVLEHRILHPALPDIRLLPEENGIFWAAFSAHLLLLCHAVLPKLETTFINQSLQKNNAQTNNDFKRDTNWIRLETKPS